MINPDLYITTLLPALYCANRLPRRAVWVVVIGPSGSGKTEFLKMMNDMEDIYPLSSISTNTFLSGMPGLNDASLLPKITGKILMIKDLTTLLSKRMDDKLELFSQLREIWDGGYHKEFGNGKTRDWVGKVSVIAASTQAFDISQQAMTHLGERFLSYRLTTPARKDVAQRCLDNNMCETQMEIEMANAFYSLMKGVNWKLLENPPKLPEKYKQALINLSNFSTMARSGVIRDKNYKNQITFVPSAEMPTRQIQQLDTIVTGIMILKNGVFTDEDMEAVFKIALDSVPLTNKMVITEMAKADNLKTAEIATALGYPTDPIRMYLENLNVLKICDRIKDGTTDRWTMKPEFVEIIRKYEKIEAKTKEELTVLHDETIAANPEEAADEEFEKFGELKTPTNPTGIKF
jgi:energy-coupling factor transporter ATP-binding protein EcfA2